MSALSFGTWWQDVGRSKFPSLRWQDVQLLWKHHQGILTQVEQSCQLLSESYPIEYILQSASFGPLELIVKAPLLIPRPHTWDWVQELSAHLCPHRVLDLGVGSGAVSVALSYLIDSPLHLVCIDKNELALEVSAQNHQILAKKNHTYEIYLSDWYANIPSSERFDLIVANPPYIAKEESFWVDESCRFEDEKALYANCGGYSDLCFIIDKGREFLTHEGSLVVEHGTSQHEGVRHLFEFYGYNRITPLYDKDGHQRATWARRV